MPTRTPANRREEATESRFDQPCSLLVGVSPDTGFCSSGFRAFVSRVVSGSRHGTVRFVYESSLLRLLFFLLCSMHEVWGGADKGNGDGNGYSYEQYCMTTCSKFLLQSFVCYFAFSCFTQRLHALLIFVVMFMRYVKQR